MYEKKPWVKFYEKGIPAEIKYPDYITYDLLENSARQYPDITAIEFLGYKLTYHELTEKVNRLATALFKLDIKKGTKVSLMLPNTPQYVISFFALARIGAIVVNTNPMYVSREMEFQFNDSDSEAVIILDKFIPKLREIVSNTPIKKIIVTSIEDFLPFPLNYVYPVREYIKGEKVPIKPATNIFHFKRLIEKYPPYPPKINITSNDVALLQYTGGTTGTPKAAQLTHKNLISNTLQISYWVTRLNFAEERFIGALPFFHVYGMTASLLQTIYLASTLYLIPNPRDIQLVLKTLHKQKITVFPGVPTMYIALINNKNVKNYDLTSIKCCISGGAPLPMDVQLNFEKLSNGKLVEGYGLTETSPVTHCNPVWGRRKTGSIGIPYPDIDAKIVDLETGKTINVGEEGELIVKGPNIMRGYYKKPGDNKKVLKNGWFYTGDIAKMDEDGYFYIVDRKKDVIIASGFNIVPREIEEVIFSHPKVQEVLVAGVPDEYRGETVKAYIVLKDKQKSTETEIKEFCKLSLAPYKIPKRIEFRESLPKSMVGKFLRRVLVEEEIQKIEKSKAALRKYS